MVMGIRQTMSSRSGSLSRRARRAVSRTLSRAKPSPRRSSRRRGPSRRGCADMLRRCGSAVGVLGHRPLLRTGGGRRLGCGSEACQRSVPWTRTAPERPSRSCWPRSLPGLRPRSVKSCRAYRQKQRCLPSKKRQKPTATISSSRVARFGDL